MDKDHSLAMQSKWGFVWASRVLLVEWEELPALEIQPWVISKQVNCLKTTGE